MWLAHRSTTSTCPTSTPPNTASAAAALREGSTRQYTASGRRRDPQPGAGRAPVPPQLPDPPAGLVAVAHRGLILMIQDRPCQRLEQRLHPPQPSGQRAGGDIQPLVPQPRRDPVRRPVADMALQHRRGPHGDAVGRAAKQPPHRRRGHLPRAVPAAAPAPPAGTDHAALVGAHIDLDDLGAMRTVGHIRHPAPRTHTLARRGPAHLKPLPEPRPRGVRPWPGAPRCRPRGRLDPGRSRCSLLRPYSRLEITAREAPSAVNLPSSDSMRAGIFACFASAARARLRNPALRRRSVEFFRSSDACLRRSDALSRRSSAFSCRNRPSCLRSDTIPGRRRDCRPAASNNLPGRATSACNDNARFAVSRIAPRSAREPPPASPAQPRTGTCTNRLWNAPRSPPGASVAPRLQRPGRGPRLHRHAPARVRTNTATAAARPARTTEATTSRRSLQPTPVQRRHRLRESPCAQR